MNRHVALRWWPLFGLVAMVVLGQLVGVGSTPIDDRFLNYREAHPWVSQLLVFTDARLVIVLYVVAAVVAALQRRWRVVAATVLTPVVAVAAVRILKRLFGREKEGALAYPSGHVTVSIVVLGMVTIVAGAAVWMFVVAGVLGCLGLLGQAFTYHYFTDTVGAVFLSTSLLCLAVEVIELDRCQPRCDVDHSGG
jgi:hypothetical protein